MKERNLQSPGAVDQDTVVRAGEEALGHARYLCEQIGPRPIGSPQNAAAADYIAAVFQRAGLDAHRQPFACPAWTVHDIQLVVAGSRLDALANTFSPPCDVAGPLAVVGTLAELAQADLSGRICVLYGELTREPLSGLSNSVYLPERHRRIAELLIEKRPMAVAAVSPAAEYPLPVFEDWTLLFASATVVPKTGLALLRHRGEQAALLIASEQTQGTSCNIIGTKTDTGASRLILCAHYDTKYGTQGAVDNASGMAVLLTLARRLASGALGCDLEFIAFSGEEYGLGGDTYLRQHGLQIIPFGSPADAPQRDSALDQAIAAINIDGVGQQVGTNCVGTIACSPDMEALVATTCAAFPAMSIIDPGPASNHYDFYTHGVPSLMLTSLGLNNVIHHPRDTTEWLGADKLGEVVVFIEQLVERLRTHSPRWSRSV